MIKKLNKTQDELLNWMKPLGEVSRGDIWNKAKTLGIKERTLADILINKQKMIPNSQQNINFR